MKNTLYDLIVKCGALEEKEIIANIRELLPDYSEELSQINFLLTCAIVNPKLMDFDQDDN